jgi:hypothetical protein
MPDNDQPSREGNGLAQLVSAVESLRPGTRQLSECQQTVVVEYEYIVEQLRPPTFSPPAPEISEFRVEGDKVKIFGKHLRGAITVTIAGVRAPAFEFQERRGRTPAFLEADVPENTDASAIVVLTSGGACASGRQSHAAEPGQHPAES